MVAQRAVLNDGVGPDEAIGADAGIAQQLDEGLNDRAGSNFHLGIDDAGIGPVDGYTRGHQPCCRRSVQLRISATNSAIVFTFGILQILYFRPSTRYARAYFPVPPAAPGRPRAAGS